MQKKTHGEQSGMVTIGRPEVSADADGWVRVKARIGLPSGETRELWYRVEAAYGDYLVHERADAFLVGLLPCISMSGGRVKSEAPISAVLLYNLRHLLSPLLPEFGPALKRVEIDAEADNTDFGAGRSRHVGTGLSCGIDSMSTVADYTGPDVPPSLRIDTLCFFDLGSHGDGENPSPEEVEHRRRLAEVRGHNSDAFAASIGLPLVKLVSNIHEFSCGLTHEGLSTFRDMSAVLSLQKLFSVYHYASSVKITDFRITIEGVSHGDEYLLRCFGTESTRLNSAMSAYSRQARTAIVGDYAPAREHLNVCVEEGRNCGKCFKCIRTIFQLDLCGALDRFAGCFDLTFYRAHRWKVLHRLSKDFHFKAEFLEAVKTAPSPRYSPFVMKLAFAVRSLEVSLLRFRRRLFWWRRRAVLIAALIAAGSAMAKDYDVRAYGAKGDGLSFDTAAVQRAIDECSAAGGGRVKLEGGTYLIKPIMLRSGVELHLDVTARLLGSGDWRDYPNRGTFRHVDSSKLPRMRDAALIAADEARNIAITGRGVIDANGMCFVRKVNDPKRPKWNYERIGGFEQSPPRVVFFTGCEDVTVRDVTMTNQPAGWSYWIHDCDRVVFDGCKVLADVHFPNNDGIHVNSSRDVSISNCRVETGDDSIVVRCNNRSLKENKVCERVTVANCQLRSYANCIRLGWCKEGIIRNCTFSNIVMHDSTVGINIWFVPEDWNPAGDWGREKTVIENCTFDNIVMDRIHSTPITVRVFESGEDGCEYVRNLAFANITSRAFSRSVFWGARTRPLENFTFANCRFVRDIAARGPWEKEPSAAEWAKPGENAFRFCRGFRFDGCTLDEE